MCPPVAVPAHPRILTGRRFLRISPQPTQQGVAGFPGDPILSTQRIPRGRDRIFSTQRIFYKKNHEKSMVCFKIFRAARANLLRIS